MTPLERREWQRRNRARLYATLAGLVVAALVLRVFVGVPL